MNREKVLGALSALGKSGAVCYVYRESAFELLSCGRVDGTLYLLSDIGTAKLKAVLEKGGYKDIADGGAGIVTTRLAGQTVEIRCGGVRNAEELQKLIRRDLSVHSLMLRSNGNIYDAFGGLADFRSKTLRLTSEEISDKEQFAAAGFEMILKGGYTPEEKTAQALDGALKTLPASKRVSLIMMFRNYLKSGKMEIRHVYNALALRGFFPNAGDLCDDRLDELSEKIRTAKNTHLFALTCYLCGLNGEQLGRIPNKSFVLEFYECFLKYIGEDLTDRERYAEAKKNCTQDCFDAVLAVKEMLTLLHGGTDVQKNANQSDGLFRSIEKSDLWRDTAEDEKSDPPMTVLPEDVTTDEPEPDASAEMPLFAGVAEEEYIEAEEDDSPPPSEQPIFRKPSDNYYLRKN